MHDNVRPSSLRALPKLYRRPTYLSLYFCHRPLHYYQPPSVLNHAKKSSPPSSFLAISHYQIALNSLIKNVLLWATAALARSTQALASTFHWHCYRLPCCGHLSLPDSLDSTQKPSSHLTIMLSPSSLVLPLLHHWYCVGRWIAHTMST